MQANERDEFDVAASRCATALLVPTSIYASLLFHSAEPRREFLKGRRAVEFECQKKSRAKEQSAVSQQLEAPGKGHVSLPVRKRRLAAGRSPARGARVTNMS